MNIISILGQESVRSTHPILSEIKGIFSILPGGDTLSITLLYFIATALIAFIISPFVISLLYKLNIRRKSKGDVASNFDEVKGKIGTPIMGGLIVIIPVIIITIMFNWVREYTYVPIGALILSSCIGGIDDLLNIFGKVRPLPRPFKLHMKLVFVHKSIWKRVFYFITIPWAFIKRAFLFVGSKPNAGLQVHEKLIMQAFIGVTVGLWVYLNNNMTLIWIPYILKYEFIQNIVNLFPGIYAVPELSSIYIGWLMVPFVALTIMTITNAVNISDGMDGLAGGLLLHAFAAYGVIAFSISEYGRISQIDLIFDARAIAYLCASVCGGLIAYLYFNIAPARVQMSDIGSLGLGTLLSVIAIALHREFTLLFIAGIFLANGIIPRLIQPLYKKITGKKLFKMIPLHYHFELKGWTEEKVVMRFWMIGLLLAAIGIWLAGI